MFNIMTLILILSITVATYISNAAHYSEYID